MFIPEIHQISFRQDTTLKYMYTYMPSHPLANKAGKVYEHVYVVVQHLGRFLLRDEVVHHRDRVRSNNDIKNLQVLTQKEHRELHLLEDGHALTKTLPCKLCGELFEQAKTEQVFCTTKCKGAHSRKFEITKEELERLVWEMPTTHVAKMLGVSDTAVAKRCKAFAIKKPPRGYWARKNKNKP